MNGLLNNERCIRQSNIPNKRAKSADILKSTSKLTLQKKFVNNYIRPNTVIEETNQHEHSNILNGFNTSEIFELKADLHFQRMKNADQRQ